MTGWLISSLAWGFCGTYVGPVGDTPTNQESRIVLVHEGDETVLTMTSDARNAGEDFGLVMPVPVDLEIGDITAPLLGSAWSDLDAFSAPRVVSYTCETLFASGSSMSSSTGGCGGSADKTSPSSEPESSVLEQTDATVEVLGVATVGAYELTLLRAQEGDSLQGWLNERGFEVPGDAAPILDDYVTEGVHFLAARVALPDDHARAWLPPLQLRYPYRSLDLPLRLGATNATESQDLTVWVIGDAVDGEAQQLTFADSEVETECMPKGGTTALEVLDESLDEALEQDGDGVAVVEYSWPTQQKCDPCPPGPAAEPATFLRAFGRVDTNAHITRLHLRYDPLAVTDDLHLGYTKTFRNHQLRYIEHLDELEASFPICFDGMASSPAGTCDADVPEQASVPWWTLLGLPLMGWGLGRRRRG